MNNKKPTWIAISDLPAYVKSLTGSKPSMSTVWRWVLKGARGRTLRSTLIGGRRYTRRRWVREFITDGEESTQSVSDTHWIKNEWLGKEVTNRRADQFLDRNGL